jgi:hypothetical protein
MIRTSLIAAASGSSRPSGAGIIPNLRGGGTAAFSQILTEALMTRLDQPRAGGSQRQEFPRPFRNSGDAHLSALLMRSSLSRLTGRGRNLAAGRSSSGSEAERLFSSGRSGRGRSVDPKVYEGIIKSAAARHQVPEDLVKAVIKVESNFNPQATSRVGAMGLMQLMPGTARDLGVQRPYDPVENINGGTKYLRELLDRYDGNVPKAVAAYNCGMANVEKGNLPQETRSYLKLVSQYYNGSQNLRNYQSPAPVSKSPSQEVAATKTYG